MERLVLDGLWQHVKENNIIRCNQHGFQKNYSCVTQLIECLNDWIADYDKGLQTRDRTIPVFGYRYRAVLASTAKYRVPGIVSSVSRAILLSGPSLIVRLSDKASTAATPTAFRRRLGLCA